ncbi:MAG TPA: zinc ribbon domain-containing protein [Pyrinomonadaceae bacterium]|nr:zinc ribbon domain-containing protein [Pyrinomonadaceae bacterium]
MPEPKIARRCPACGASIRDHAFFCPQCGGKLAPPAPPKEEAAAIHDTVEETIDLSQTMTEGDFRAIAKASQPKVHKQSSEGVKKTVRERALGEGSKIQRVTSKARDVEGDVKQRVQKFREISNVVIDEANYDPSLRFVLVAVGLFILFLVIVLLNNLIG